MIHILRIGHTSINYVTKFNDYMLIKKAYLDNFKFFDKNYALNSL